MLSDNLGSLKSGRCLTGMASPRLSDNTGTKFGINFSAKLMNGNMSVKSTKTGILKEVNSNVPWLTHLMEKTTLGHSPETKQFISSPSQPDFDRPTEIGESRRIMGSQSSIKKRVTSERVWFSEVAQLEALVTKKDDLVVMIDENEAEIEKLVNHLTTKKKGIREEQNKLLKELEDLGLKLKDFDKPAGINFRNCTVVSPYLTRCSQQVINKLRGVAENISDKETRDEVARAIESISYEREERENLVLSLLSLDTGSLREKLNSLHEELQAKNSDKAETVARLETLATEIAKLDQAIEEDKHYQERVSQLRSLKNNAVINANNISEVLTNILNDKNRIENEIKGLHQVIREKVTQKNSVNSNLCSHVDSMPDGAYSNLKQFMAELRTASFSNYEIFYELVSALRELEVTKQLDLEFSGSQSVAHSKELIVGAINLVGRVISMMGRSNAENAVASFTSDYLQVVPEQSLPQELTSATSQVVDRAQKFLPIKFDHPETSEETEVFIQKLKSYLTESARNLDTFYDLMQAKLELSEGCKQLMADVQTKEQKLTELSREQSEIVNSIPTIKNQSRAYNYQLTMLLLNGGVQAPTAEDLPRDTVGDHDDGLEGGWTARNDEEEEIFQSNQEKKDLKMKENQSLEEKIQQVTEDLKEVADNIRKTEHEQEYVIEKVKTYRRGLIDGLNKELKEFQCIASLFDYMSKPVLSREIGVSVMDSLLHDLAGVVQQINSEINRQKRIIKLVNKNEDYSHEEKVFDEMLTESIFNIKSELGQLNEKQIPELKGIENSVNEAELVNMELKEELNQVLDAIENTEQSFLMSLESALSNCAFCAEQIPGLFVDTPKLRESNYQDYILNKLAEEEEMEQHNTSEVVSQIDSTYMDYRHTANPRLGGQNCISQPRSSNASHQYRHGSSSKMHTANLINEQLQYKGQEEFDDYQMEAEMQQSLSQRSVTLDDNAEDNEVNEMIISAFPKKLFSKVLAVHAQTYDLFRSVVLEKLTNGIIISRKQKLAQGITANSTSLCPLKFMEDQQSRKKKSSVEAYGYSKRLMRFDFDACKLQFFSNKAKPKTTPSKQSRDDRVSIGVSCRWVLEEEYDLDEVAGIQLPDVSTKMLKARLKEFYQPSQLGVYNQAELYYLEKCEMFLFSLDLMEQGRIECLVDSFGMFLDIYAAISFLQH